MIRRSLIKTTIRPRLFAKKTPPRLKTRLRVQAHLRRCEAAGAFATVARRGDPDAGSVAVKVYMGAGAARLHIESRDLDGEKIWREPLGEERGEPAIDQWLEKEINIDPDLWIIEIEDRDGRAFFDDAE